MNRFILFFGIWILVVLDWPHLKAHEPPGQNCIAEVRPSECIPHNEGTFWILSDCDQASLALCYDGKKTKDGRSVYVGEYRMNNAGYAMRDASLRSFWRIAKVSAPAGFGPSFNGNTINADPSNHSKCLDADFHSTNIEGCKVQLWDQKLFGLPRDNQEWCINYIGTVRRRKLYRDEMVNARVFEIQCKKDGKYLGYKLPIDSYGLSLRNKLTLRVGLFNRGDNVYTRWIVID